MARIPRPLLLLRTYSGLDPEDWRPSSTPAIGRLVEGLAARGVEGVALFCDRTPSDGAAVSELTPVTHGVFGALAVYRLGYRPVPGPSVLGGVINRGRALVAALRLYRRHGCRSVVADRVHLAEAALLACLRIPVLWRCLGVMPFLVQRHSAAPFHRVLFWINRVALAAPIAMLLCTRDGTPWWRVFPRRWQGRRLIVALNGVDRDDPAPARVETIGDPPRILFVNRMTEHKNPAVLVEVMARLKRRGVAFCACLAGYGPELERVREAVEAAGLADRVSIPGRVASADLPVYRRDADIAVLLNRGGQLSNTMLEALAAGLCPVGFGPDPETGFDQDTAAVLPETLMVRIDRGDPVTSLTEALASLIADPPEIARRKQAARAFAQSRLDLWSERIDREIALLATLEARAPDPSIFEEPKG